MSSEKDIREGFEERFNIFVKRADTRVEYRIGPQKGLADINKLKVHLTRKCSFSQNESTCYSKHLGEKVFELGRILDPLCPFKVAPEVLHDRVLGSLGRRLLMTSTQEPNTMAPQSVLCICSRKWKTKLIVPIYFGTKTSKFCSRIIFFFVTGVRVRFQFGRHRNRLRSSTFDKRELSA